MTDATARALERYVRMLRNRTKKRYALDWIAYRLTDKPLPQSEWGLSVMAAQAVRMNIDAILKAQEQ